MVDSERLETAEAFNHEHLGYTTFIFEDTPDCRFCLWTIKKFKEVTEFIKKICVCDMYVISPEELIAYESLAKEATDEYYDIVDSKRWETATGKEKSQDQYSLLRAYTVAI